ncbi:MAG: trehalose-phosphatase [Anaerolineales bacterium]|nr:trehalose-phosphatase [Anaerolineales bacterium]
MTVMPRQIREYIQKATCLWLFLDYDGTLADFAPTPDDVYPDPEVIELITQISQQPSVNTAIISGRRLTQIQTLLPGEGIWFAGTYGIELQSPEGKLIHRLSYEEIRPTIENIKPIWKNILNKHAGFYLEDKGWSLAIHTKDVPHLEAKVILTTAREKAATLIVHSPFRLLGGDRFLEIAPIKANKANAVEYLMGKNNLTDFYSVYIGDDDKDEQAFSIIKKHGGVAILVSTEPSKTLADFRLQNPQSVLQWLRELSAYLKDIHNC